MKTKSVLVAIFMVALIACAANAQVPAKPIDIGIGGGFTMPMGDFSDQSNIGFHGALEVGIKAIPKINLVGRVAFHTFSMSDDGKTAFGSLMGTVTDYPSTSLIAFGVDAKYALGVPGAPTKPFLLFGGGFASIKQGEYTFTHPTTNADVTVASESVSDPYIEFGAGVEFVKLFGQARYVILMTEGSSTTYIPFTIGLRF